MTQTWDESSKRRPVTRLSTPPLIVTQIKTVKTDGYAAVQVGSLTGKKRTPNNPLKGQLAKLKNPQTLGLIREIKVSNPEEFTLGQEISVSSVLKVGATVAVQGTSKGKGFAGVVKRWNFRGGPKTHGQSDRHRAPGSIGQGTDPGRVHKGKKMAGRMGNETKTVPNLTVLKIDEDMKEIWVSGPIPGSIGSPIVIHADQSVVNQETTAEEIKS